MLSDRINRGACTQRTSKLAPEEALVVALRFPGFCDQLRKFEEVCFVLV